MERVSLTMILEDLSGLPPYELPEPYQSRTFHEGEETTWAEIEHAAGEFPSLDKARSRFKDEFGSHVADLCDRCTFLEDGEGRAVGTATAWFSPSFKGGRYGRLHFVAIHPEYQGRGLSKPLVSLAMDRLSSFHDRAYLTTQTTSWIAIKVYLDFGFRPLVERPDHIQGWRMMWNQLGHPALSTYAD